MELGWRMKLLVLWLLQGVNYVAYILISLRESSALGTVGSVESAEPVRSPWAAVAAALLVWTAWLYPNSSR